MTSTAHKEDSDPRGTCARVTDRGFSMVGEKSSLRASQDELLRQAAAILRGRYRCGGRYSGLSSTAAAELGNALETVRTDADHAGVIDREEAVALAHRLVDDDQPELSPLWPRPST
jgi:hypothetical protein